ncbi:MAG TPA: glutamyl-tRNA reductase [Actinocrinis sp.]|jgi:glutamyl-tRNA reductase
MSLLVIGLSHRTAPMPLLEKAALHQDRVLKLLGDAVGTEHVAEAVAVATCNRLELYADVGKFHGALADLSSLLSGYTGVPMDELTPHFYVHYDNRAVQHLFNVACGLDSMVVGEPQILGQLRRALADGQAQGTAGRVLNELVQTGLRVGKRAHSETGLDRAGQSLVASALALADVALADVTSGEQLRAVVVGAGSMSALAATTLARSRPGLDLTIVNRSPGRAAKLAETVGARVLPLERLAEAVQGAHLVLSCTGATETVLTAAHFGDWRPAAIVDLALPRDVDAEIAELPGVDLIDLERIAEAERGSSKAQEDSIEAVQRIVAQELAAYTAAQNAAAVGPTVAALRSMAAVLVEAELSRFHGRVPDLDAKAGAEVANTVRRVVDKLLHEPTVRVKQLAADPGGTSYAAALRELFNLDPAAAAAVSRAEPPAAPAPPSGLPAPAEEEDRA